MAGVSGTYPKIQGPSPTHGLQGCSGDSAGQPTTDRPKTVLEASPTTSRRDPSEARRLPGLANLGPFASCLGSTCIISRLRRLHHARLGNAPLSPIVSPSCTWTLTRTPTARQARRRHHRDRSHLLMGLGVHGSEDRTQTPSVALPGFRVLFGVREKPPPCSHACEPASSTGPSQMYYQARNGQQRAWNGAVDRLHCHDASIVQMDLVLSSLGVYTVGRETRIVEQVPLTAL